MNYSIYQAYPIIGNLAMKVVEKEIGFLSDYHLQISFIGKFSGLPKIYLNHFVFLFFFFFYRCGDNVQHFKIFKDERKYYLWIRKFPSLNQLVEYHKTNSVSKTQHILLNEVNFRVS